MSSDSFTVNFADQSAHPPHSHDDLLRQPNTNAAPDQDTDKQPVFELRHSEQWIPWMEENNASIAISTYQSGKIIFFGRQADQKHWMFNRTIGRCLGMAYHVTEQGNKLLYVGGEYSIHQFSNTLNPGATLANGSDLMLHPQARNVTGALDIHDMHTTSAGDLVFVNTSFNCIAQMTPYDSFFPLWVPPFLDRLYPEDRCHVNGLAMRDGQPRYASACSTINRTASWREVRRNGGVLVDMQTDAILADGLSMPHSPRWHEGALYFHDSGNGYFCRIDPATQRVERIAFLPGYLRGLSFHNGYALMGTSISRHNDNFAGLGLETELQKRDAEPVCAVFVIDPRSGEIVASAFLRGVVTELYDVLALPGVRQVSASSPHSLPDLQTMISLGRVSPTGIPRMGWMAEREKQAQSKNHQ